MRDFRTPVLALAVALLAGVAGWWVGQRALEPPLQPLPAGIEPLAIGDPWLDLSLPDVHGQPRRLSGLADPPLVLNFWATWCPPCIREMPVLDAFAAERDRHGMTVIGIALDEAEAVRQFLARTPVRYPILLDRNAADDSSVRYGNTRGVLPYTVVVDSRGRIAATRLGEIDRDLLDAWAAEHARHGAAGSNERSISAVKLPPSSANWTTMR